jgi:hypothetical protein
MLRSLVNSLFLIEVGTDLVKTYDTNYPNVAKGFQVYFIIDRNSLRPHFEPGSKILPTYLLIGDVFKNKDFAQRAVSDVISTLGVMGITLTPKIIPYEAQQYDVITRWPIPIERHKNAMTYKELLKDRLTFQALNQLRSETELRFDPPSLNSSYYLIILHKGELYPFPISYSHLAHNYEQTFNKLFRIIGLDAKILTYPADRDPLYFYTPELEKFVKKYDPTFKGSLVKDFEETRLLFQKHANWFDTVTFHFDSPFVVAGDGGCFFYGRTKTHNNYYIGPYLEHSPQYKSAQQVFPQLLKLLGEDVSLSQIEWQENELYLSNIEHMQDHDTVTSVHTHQLADPASLLSLLAIHEV